MTAEQRYEYYYEDAGHEDSGSDETIAEDNNESDEDNAENQRQIKHRRTEVSPGAIFRIVVVSMIAAALLGSVIYSLDRRNRVYHKAADLNRQLSLTEAENVRLQSELDSKMSAKNVEDYAENVLKMRKIDSSQIKYIKIQTGDVVNIPEQDQGLMAKIESFFDKCVEYFRG
jgi:Na+-transporting NADH:ubiquinone oxidoreductase subunit NqrC